MTFNKIELIRADYVTLSRTDRDVNPSGGNLGADTRRACERSGYRTGMWNTYLSHGVQSILKRPFEWLGGDL